MRLRPSVPAACAVVALLGAAAPAAFAGDPVAAAGSATSAVTLLRITAAGHDLVAGGVRLTSDTTGSTPAARVTVTPLTADGTAYGEQTLGPGESKAVGGASSSTLVPALKGLVDLTSPAVQAGATVADGNPATTAGADSLGSLSVLGLPVRVGGAMTSGSAVTGSLARSVKTLEVKDVALPSIADLLGALGLDLSKLPLSTVQDLVGKLGLTNEALTAANDALAAAQAAVKTQTDAATAKVNDALAQVDAAQRDLTAKTTALAPLEDALLKDNAAVTAARAAVAAANQQLAAARTAQKAAQAAVDAAKAALPKDPVTGAVVGLVDPTLTTALSSANDLVTQATAAAAKAATDLANAQSVAAAAQAAVDAGRSAVALAQSALDAANRLLDSARATLAGLTANLQPQLDALRQALTAVLDGTPLVSLDDLAVTSQSLVTGAGDGEQSAVVTGGQVAGLHVLGTDVLSSVLGASTVDVTRLTGSTLQQVTDKVNALTGVLSTVLSTVPGLPALKVPAPTVDLLTSKTSTGVTDGFGTAAASITGLQVTLPAIQLPTSVALPAALSLPGVSVLPPGVLSGKAVGDVLTSSPVAIGLGTLAETASFRPGVPASAPGTAAPGTTTPGADVPVTDVPVAQNPTTGVPTDAVPVAAPQTLPRTGLPAGLAALAALLVGTAVVLRRRELAQR